jgi:hypothetical protein
MSSRALAWTGPAFTVVFVVAVLVFEGSPPGEKASGESVVRWYDSHQGQAVASVFLTPLLVLLLVAFASHLRALARGLTDGAGPSVMLGGAVLWAGGLLLGSTLKLALVSAADHDKDQVAETLNVLAACSWLPFIAGIAVTLFGAGMTVLSTGLLPTWLGWVAVVVGVVSLAGPGGFLGFFVGPLWLLVAGIMLATGARQPVEATT